MSAITLEIIIYTAGSVVAVSLISLVGVFAISFKPKHLAKIILFLIPLAVGALLGDAFFHLIPESFESANEPEKISLLIILGIVSFFLLEKFLRWHHHHNEIETADENIKHKHIGSLIVISDGLHNLIDGIIIGVSYLVGIKIGLATTLAIILHEIPQEIGDFGVLIHAGYSKSKAILYNFLSALMAILGAAVVLVLGSLPEKFIEGIIPFAAGTFIYIATSDLVPELHKNSDENKTVIQDIVGIGLGLFLMYALLFLE